MEKRYQVFVSSTYEDLLDERSEVMQALLELDCMPAGMELFPAANETQWNWIMKVINESDYYIVIIGGRYGSVSDKTGLSYTEMEYRYAVETKKPVISFLHQDPQKIPSGLCEKTPEGIEGLKRFRELCETRLCKYWSSPADLGAKVSRGLTQLIKQHPATGWVKSDLALKDEYINENLELRRKIEKLEELLERTSTEIPSGTENLSQGNNLYEIQFSFIRKEKREGKNYWYKKCEDYSSIKISWDDIFKYLSPIMMQPQSEYIIIRSLNEFIASKCEEKLMKKYPDERFEFYRILDQCLKTIKIQLRALNLINIHKNEYWQLTPYGEKYMNKLIAINKNNNINLYITH